MIKIPKEAFKTQAEDGSDVLPAVGDEVSLAGFTGTVQSEDGDALVINLTEYNGVPVEYAEEAKPVEADGEESVKDSLIEQMEKGEEA